MANPVRIETHFSVVTICKIIGLLNYCTITAPFFFPLVWKQKNNIGRSLSASLTHTHTVSKLVSQAHFYWIEFDPFRMPHTCGFVSNLSCVITGARGVTVIVLGNRLSEVSSNPGWSRWCFTFVLMPLRKAWTHLFSLQLRINRRA